MEVQETTIDGLKIIKPDIFYDFRGQYVETFNVDKYNFLIDNEKQVEFKEDDLSISRYRVLRGLHGDDRTAKLIQCIYGAFYLVIVDFRDTSPTYLKWHALTLSDENRFQVFVPSGCVNGHLCVTDKCIFSYKQSSSYLGASKQVTLRWDDPKLGIYWPIKDPILSQRDAYAALL